MKCNPLMGALAAQAVVASCAADPVKSDSPFSMTTTNKFLRNAIYYDQYHLTTPPKSYTAGYTHVIMAFANSSLFVGEEPGKYKPFQPIETVRKLFDNGTQVCIALGGWGDTAGFSEGAKTEESRALYAKNLKAMIEEHNFDCLDVDWEFPAGNSEDYKRNGTRNSDKVGEIETFPLFLQAIKDAIGNKELTIAVPGRKADMIAYTEKQAPAIWKAVDHVNIMTYDLMNRRDTKTTHHTSVEGSLEAIENYLALGLPASKISLGFAFYAKYFQTPPDITCTDPVGCPIVLAEDPETGDDLGTSGALTFETANMRPAPTTNVTKTPDGTCGATVGLTCAGYTPGSCCSSSGYCGSDPEYCGVGCQASFSKGCTGPDIASSWIHAMANGTEDVARGGQWWWDENNALYWTWDTKALIARKFQEIVVAKNLGGVFAWSLGEDTFDYGLIQTIHKEVKLVNAAKALTSSLFSRDSRHVRHARHF